MVSFLLSHLLAEGDDFTSALELARFCWQFSRTNVQKREKTSLRVHDFKLKSQSILSRGFLRTWYFGELRYYSVNKSGGDRYFGRWVYCVTRERNLRVSPYGIIVESEILNWRSK